MSANKTQPTSQPVGAYLSAIEDVSRRNDARDLVKLISGAIAAEPVMWGESIVGFGNYHYTYESGRSGDTPAVGFSARKQALVFYGLFHYEDNQENIALAKRLGSHTHGKGCLYIRKLSDINPDILKEMVKNAFKSRANE